MLAFIDGQAWLCLLDYFEAPMRFFALFTAFAFIFSLLPSVASSQTVLCANLVGQCSKVATRCESTKCLLQMVQQYPQCQYRALQTYRDAVKYTCEGAAQRTKPAPSQPSSRSRDNAWAMDTTRFLAALGLGLTTWAGLWVAVALAGGAGTIKLAAFGVGAIVFGTAYYTPDGFTPMEKAVGMFERQINKLSKTTEDIIRRQGRGSN